MNFEQFFNNVNSPILVCRLEEHLPVIYINDCAKTLFWSEQCPTESSAANILGAEESVWTDFETALIEKGEVLQTNMELTLQSGVSYQSKIAANTFELEGTTYVKICIVKVCDGAGDKDTDVEMKYNFGVLSVITNNLDSIIFVTDVRTRNILFANNALAAVPGVSVGDLIGRQIGDILDEYNIDSEYKSPLDEMIGPDGEILKEFYIWEYFNPTTKRWYLVRDAIIKWIDGTDVQIETATEITDQKDQQAALEYVASVDMMTQTFNREWGRRLLEHILADKESKQENVLVFIDLDHLKSTNDKYGHAAGDEMIIKTVGIIQSCTRRSDVICRWGGDEFLLIIRADEEKAEIVMNKIQRSLAEYNATGESVFKLSFSYGIVGIIPDKYENVDELISIADQKMYKDKERLYVEEK